MKQVTQNGDKYTSSLRNWHKLSRYNSTNEVYITWNCETNS